MLLSEINQSFVELVVRMLHAIKISHLLSACKSATWLKRDSISKVKFVCLIVHPLKALIVCLLVVRHRCDRWRWLFKTNCVDAPVTTGNASFGSTTQLNFVTLPRGCHPSSRLRNELQIVSPVGQTSARHELPMNVSDIECKLTSRGARLLQAGQPECFAQLSS